VVEVVVRENLDKAYVLRAPGRLPQIHISAEMHIDLIKEHLADQISAVEFEQFENLWTDDSHSREFVKEGNYLKIMNKE
jgi:hypothetical protein